LAPRFFIDCSKLDTVCILMLSLPCAMLAAAVVFRRYGAHQVEYMTRETVPVWCIFAFFIHLALHLALLIIIVECIDVDESVAHDEMKHAPYEKVASETPYNWFNTNYAHCLRSKYLNKDGGAWCIPVAAGREYLLEKAPELGLFFEGEDLRSRAGSTMADDLSFMAAQAASKARDAAHRLHVPNNWVEPGATTGVEPGAAVNSATQSASLPSLPSLEPKAEAKAEAKAKAKGKAKAAAPEPEPAPKPKAKAKGKASQ